MTSIGWIGLLIWVGVAYAQPVQRTNHIHQEFYSDSIKCYDEDRHPQRCVPHFVNAAYGRRVNATNTCGVTRVTRYCVQTGHTGMRKSCADCSEYDERDKHSPDYLVDLNDPHSETWWQSETMWEGMQYPNMVNLTLQFKKSFSITYVRLKFHSPRPESFAIYKKTTDDGDWIPWIYYSASCRATYGVPEGATILPQAEDVAVCTKEFSDISPISGGDVVFSTLEGRPSAHRYEDSEVLQDWVTATAVRIVLNRMNTFGDEVFRDEKVLRSYYYAISDFAVGGRCKCNGHASECPKSTGEGDERMVCQCQHNTDGVDCERCKDFYQDSPWAPARADDAHECKMCNCSGHSILCEFDQALFDETGHGGRCQACRDGTEGINCERCLENHWRPEGSTAEIGCMDCMCNEDGSTGAQCDNEGQCPCKEGVGGKKCDMCLVGHYEFTASGCRDCGCHESGSLHDPGQCDVNSGDCYCKQFVEGKQCDRCPPGYFNLDFGNHFGCTKCFCFGHFKSCDVAEGYYSFNITSDFDMGKQGWSADSVGRELQVQMSGGNTIAVSDTDGRPVYFVAPKKFLGDQRASYNQDLVFTLRTSQPGRNYHEDVIIKSTDGRQISTQIFAQDNPQPAYFDQTFKYRLHEDAQYRWTPAMSPHDFMAILSNISAIYIRGTYQTGATAYLSYVSLGSAANPDSETSPAKTPLDLTDQIGWVERCECLEGHVGQFCESCETGYKRESRNGGRLSRCIPCQCHGHGDVCDAETGVCECRDNTAGDKCERCATGYYGNALNGTEDDCQQCPCPQNSACRLHSDGKPWCTNCPLGYTGRLCDACSVGYYGNPKEGQDCKICECSGNVDQNAVLPCNSITGECIECIHDTAGFHCERCEDGYWGDALLEPKGDCEACHCHTQGTRKPSMDYEVLLCDQLDGQCDCLDHVIGQQCDTCEPGYFNLTSGGGCEACNCDAVGSVNSTCDMRSGACKCKPGVTGRQCDRCAMGYFGFSSEGCEPCECDRTGSVSTYCDVESGQCDCKPNVDGRQCDRCMENMFGLRQPGGCRECAECYTLVQTRVNAHRAKLEDLHDILKEIMENPVTVNDTDFDNTLADVKAKVKELADMVTNELADGDEALVGQVEELEDNLAKANDYLKQMDKLIEDALKYADDTNDALKTWEGVRESAEDDLDRARTYLATDGVDAWAAAKEASERYGEESQQLSKLAKEARKLATQHEVNAGQIENTAGEALNMSTDALRAATEAIFGAGQTSREISKLKDKFEKIDELYNVTKKMAQDQQAMTNKAVEAATSVLTEVEGLTLPKVDPAGLGDRAQTLIKEAKLAKDNAELEATNNRGLVEEAKKTSEDARNALREAEGAQQQADEILLDLDLAREKAQTAVDLANKTLTDAQETLDTLLEFDQLVEKSRKKALEELERLPEIESRIEDAKNLTTQGETALGSAKNDADMAQQIATEAQKSAEQAAKDASNVRDRAEQTKQSAVNMKAEAEALKKKLDKEQDTLDNYETQAGKDKEQAHKAVTAAHQASVAAGKANQTVTTAMNKVRRVLDKLKSLDDLSTDELDELEAQVAEAQKTLEEADLAGRVTELQNAQTTQQRKLNDYERDIDQLRKDVENIEQIRDSLPDKCFNVVKLEQGA